MEKKGKELDRKKLQNALARLESVNDHMVAEMQDLDALLRAVGFAEGLHSLRLAAKELLELLL